MTKNGNGTKSTISRRSVFAGAAATTCTIGMAEARAPDPIFSVLERFRIAQGSLFKAIKAADLPREQWLTPSFSEAQGNLKHAYACFKEVRLELLTTMPTTRAGLASLLVQLGQATNDIEPNVLVEAMCWDDEPTREAASTVLSRVAGLVLTIRMTDAKGPIGE